MLNGMRTRQQQIPAHALLKLQARHSHLLVDPTLQPKAHSGANTIHTLSVDACCIALHPFMPLQALAALDHVISRCPGTYLSWAFDIHKT